MFILHDFTFQFDIVFLLAGALKLKLGQYNEAMKHYESLIERNQENTLYYNKLVEAKQLTNNDDIFQLLTHYISKYPKATVPKRLSLNYVSGKLT